MAQLVQKTLFTLHRGEFSPLFWSVPDWPALAQEPARHGIVRHGRLASARSLLSADLKPSYPEHAARYLAHVGDPGGATPRTLLAWGSRNTLQNLGLPGWHAQRTPRLLCRPDEPWQRWTYHALCGLANGKPVLQAVRFQSAAGSETAAIVPVEQGEPGAAPIEWAVIGQALLWDGTVTPLELLAAGTYDLRHIWALRWEAWQNSPRDRAIHEELIDSFMSRLDQPAEARAAALAEIAARHSLRVARSYLHSTIGLTADGDLNLLMQTGSLAELGEAHKALGSQRAILLDNGGSVGAAYWSRYEWQKSGWQRVRDRPLFLGNGSYFRPQGHSVLVTELREDISEGPSAFESRQG